MIQDAIRVSILRYLKKGLLLPRLGFESFKASRPNGGLYSGVGQSQDAETAGVEYHLIACTSEESRNNKKY